MAAAPELRAGNVVPMPATALADHAGQVFLGTVSDVRSYWAVSPRRIESEVRFTAVEYLKGALSQHPGDEFVLVVPGGEVDGVGLAVACAPAFRPGERWLLFLLPSYNVFPVVGLNQGAFRIQSDGAGVPRVYSAASQAIAGVGADGWVRTSAAARQNRVPAANDRVLVDAILPIAEPEAAVSLDEFRAALAPVLAASRDHGLTAPAGRRNLVQFTPVPMRGAAGEAAIASETMKQRGLEERRPQRVEGADRLRRRR